MQPVAPIEVQPPVPSILTTARDRTGDQFGARAVPDVDPIEGSPPSADYAWRTGLSWTPATCQRSSSWPNCPSAADVAGKKNQADAALWGPVETAPFWVYTPVECDWSLNYEQLGGLADTLTAVHTAYGVARALWLGEGLPDVPTQPTLRRVASDVTPAAGAVDLDDAVSLLLAEYEVASGGNGGAILHVPAVAMPAMTGGVPGGSVVARLNGTHYDGPLGSWVSPGPGYPFGASADGADGFGPKISTDPDPEEYAGNNDDEVWLYISGPVEWAAGPLQPHHTRTGGELRRNRVEILSERQAIVRFDPCPVYACLAVAPVAFVGIS